MIYGWFSCHFFFLFSLSLLLVYVCPVLLSTTSRSFSDPRGEEHVCVGELSRTGSSLEGHSDLANSVPIPQPKNLENVWLGTKQPRRSQGWAAAMLCHSHAKFCWQWD